MTVEFSNNSDQHTDGQQPSDDTQLEYREISEEELKQILEDHKKWLESDEKEGEKADLQRANLQYINLSGANLQKANLKEANLQKADLSKANLQKAILKDTNLQKANLSEANLQKAFLYKANLQKAILKQANLQKANLYKANLQKANLYKANLQKAILDRANLQKAIFSKANLQKAILDGTNLQKANFSNANLQRAFLYRAYLQKANFIESNLQKAYLIEANLSNANLYKAELQNTALNRVKGLNVANLQYANFEGATGLLGNEFAQADVTGTKLPEGIKDFKALEIVKETSQNARKIFFAMILGCVYSWLTIATTTDVKLLTNTASSPLPIIGTDIPIAWFYIAAPLVLICLYFYFHLYLDNLWKGLANLPAIFHDGKPLDQRAYPWLLNTLVRKHFKRLQKRSFIARMKEWVTIFLAWWVVPITMIAFWLRYIPRHEWWGTYLHIGLIVISVAFAMIFYRRCSLTLQGKEKLKFKLVHFWKDRRLYRGLSVVMVGALFSLLSYGAIESEVGCEQEYILSEITSIVPLIFSIIGFEVSADFREKTVSEIPSNYGLIDKNERIEFVKGANLRFRNLKNANMYNAFLVKADLQGTKLNGAFLVYANFHKATFSGANLQKACLTFTNLQQAQISRVDLHGADLMGANLQQANLEGTNLQQAFLHRANLQQVDLAFADLSGAKYLTIEQLCKVKTLYKTILDSELMEQVKKFCPHLLVAEREKKTKKRQKKTTKDNS